MADCTQCGRKAPQFAEPVFTREPVDKRRLIYDPPPGVKGTEHYEAAKCAVCRKGGTPNQLRGARNVAVPDRVWAAVRRA